VNADLRVLNPRIAQIRAVEGFQSLHQQHQRDVLQLAEHSAGPEISRSIREKIALFERGYQEETLVAQKIIGFSLTGSCEVQRSMSGSIADQLGYDIRVGHIYLDAKSSPSGVSHQLSKNASLSKTAGLPPCLSVIPIEGNSFRVVFRAQPVTIRVNGDLVENPGAELFQAIRAAEAQIDNLITPTHRP
jgi:hypothetical protein